MKCPVEQIPRKLDRCWARWALFVFGWFNIVLGTIGIFVPGLPTTVFILIAFWAFSTSSDRFHSWLWNHPRFGELIRNWHIHRVIPVKAKFMAVTMMSASYLYLAFYVAENWMLPTFMAAIMLPSALYIVTRNSQSRHLVAVRIEEPNS